MNKNFKKFGEAVSKQLAPKDTKHSQFQKSYSSKVPKMANPTEDKEISFRVKNNEQNI